MSTIIEIFPTAAKARAAARRVRRVFPDAFILPAAGGQVAVATRQPEDGWHAEAFAKARAL